MAIDYKIRLDGIDRVTKMFDDFPAAQQRGIVSALNKLGAQGATIAKRAITERYNIKSSDVAKKIKLIRAVTETSKRMARHFVIITAAAQSFRLFEFGGLPKQPYPQKGVPVKARKPATIKILRDKPRRAVSKRDQYAREHVPFVQRTKRGFITLWERDTTKMGEETINPVYARMNLIAMFRFRGAAALTRMLQEKGMAIFLHELQYFTDKLKK